LANALALIAMVFGEIFRLIVAMCAAPVAIAAGNHFVAPPEGRSIGAAIGVFPGYVVGGIVGRLMNGGVSRSTLSSRQAPAPDLLAGTLLASIDVLVKVESPDHGFG
jgi:hypothetical protein